MSKYPVLSDEALQKARGTALMIYESLLDIATDPDSYRIAYGCGPHSVYPFLKMFPVLVTSIEPDYGKFGFDIRSDGSLVLRILERGPKTDELEAIVGNAGTN